MIRVHVRAAGRPVPGRLSAEALELPDGSSLRDALEKLAREAGAAVAGNMTLVAVNGRRVGAERHAGHLLADGDVVSVIDAVVGG